MIPVSAIEALDPTGVAVIVVRHEKHRSAVRDIHRIACVEASEQLPREVPRLGLEDDALEFPGLPLAP